MRSEKDSSVIEPRDQRSTYTDSESLGPDCALDLGQIDLCLD
jgi:hypothetical protein